ncbi:hypothetical protein [Nostoc parmelioides]|uniref:Uncharacterized protein n=1 Tax=Nostoc parmelioides FACHB-3921 TaxID=2692909 RepID=A0ABR8BEE8_9NOSO|nr:hypothetical protein [Nostoc parmelioides]MBD2252084.1 hypothetical protein [Nostoc parmelioides FACHB-3921]
MSNHINPEKFELFTELSKEQQQSIYGGNLLDSFGLYDFFFQKKDVASFANNIINFKDGQTSFDNKQETGYLMSQISFGFRLGNNRSSSRTSESGWNLFDLLSFLLYVIV